MKSIRLLKVFYFIQTLNIASIFSHQDIDDDSSDDDHISHQDLHKAPNKRKCIIFYYILNV